MQLIEKFSTMKVPARHRLDYWNQVTDQTFRGTRVDFNTRSHDASMLRWQVGDLHMARATANALVVQRQACNDPASAERLVLHLQHRGTGRFTADGKAFDLQNSSFVLNRSDIPYLAEVSDEHELLMVEFPRSSLAALVPDLDAMMHGNIISGNAAGNVLHDFLLSLWRHGDISYLDAHWGQAMGKTFLDLVALALKSAATSGNPHGSLQQRVLAFVNANLYNPELGTARIAAELGVSERTVQTVFADMAMTPSSFIAKRRLDCAADMLRVQSSRTITDVAMDVGFNDSNYFSRCFRKQFGATPRAWRDGLQ